MSLINHTECTLKLTAFAVAVCGHRGGDVGRRSLHDGDQQVEVCRRGGHPADARAAAAACLNLNFNLPPNRNLQVPLVTVTVLGNRKVKCHCMRLSLFAMILSRVVDGYAVDHNPEVDFLGENDRLTGYNRSLL